MLEAEVKEKTGLELLGWLHFFAPHLSNSGEYGRKDIFTLGWYIPLSL